jgi:hypothetical protein
MGGKQVNSSRLIRIGIVAALGLHAIAHTLALSALLGQALGSVPQLAVRTWLVPGLTSNAAAAVAIPFWAVASVAFALAAVSFWGVSARIPDWRQLAVGGAIVSTAAIAIFAGTWPGSPDASYSLLNQGVAVAMNVVVLGSQLVLHWPPERMFGR